MCYLYVINPLKYKSCLIISKYLNIYAFDHCSFIYYFLLIQLVMHVGYKKYSNFLKYLLTFSNKVLELSVGLFDFLLMDHEEDIAFIANYKRLYPDKAICFRSNVDDSFCSIVLKSYVERLEVLPYRF